METDQNYQQIQPNEDMLNRQAKEIKYFFQKPPVPLPRPSKENLPAKPDENPDPTRLFPGVNEPEKNDPTRTIEKPDGPQEPSE
jgi:hypothetical protein